MFLSNKQRARVLWRKAVELVGMVLTCLVAGVAIMAALVWL